MKTDQSKSPQKAARFTSGAPMSHILNMTVASSIGLIAVFSVDFIDLFFLSQLDNKNIQAALGFTGTVLFATISLGIGLSIAAAATVARAAGEGDQEKTERRVTNNLLYAIIISSLTGLILWFALPAILSMLGAKAETFSLSLAYLQILVPTMPLFAVSIASAAMLRSLGDIKRSAYVTIGGGLTNAVLDPLFIFTFGLELQGAAIATAIARAAMVLIGLYSLYHCHKIKIHLSVSTIKPDYKPFLTIAIPAILTNLATPIGNGYVTYVAAGYGNAVVAAWAVIARIVPLSFCASFALSGAIGPIIGQNFGAQKLNRIKQTLKDAVTFNTLYFICIWIILSLSSPWIVALFQLEGETASLVRFFLIWLSPGFGMIGYLFIANAALNNLDKPHLSTWLNWARATIGTVPFVYFGAFIAGSKGLLAGQIIGGAVIAFISLYICNKWITQLIEQQQESKAS